ncbi:MAG: sigma-70 family RNA polymerase sigma factor [Agriterribacter sp.]
MVDALLQNLKLGDRESFHTLYFMYHARLYQYIYKYTRSEWLAEETVQLSFVKIWETKENLSISYSFSTQLFRVAKSIVIDLLRKEAVRSVQSTTVHADIENIQSPEYVSAESKEALNYALHVINEMPPVQRQVFSYSRIDDLSHKEIAQKMSISTKTVETHITRALKQLKKAIPLFYYLFCLMRLVVIIL